MYMFVYIRYRCTCVCIVHQIRWQLHHSECKNRRRNNVPTFESRNEGIYKRLRSVAATELSPGVRPTSDPLNMIGREAGLMRCRVEYYTGDRFSEKVQEFSTVMLETAGPSQRLAPIHRQQVLPKGAHLSTVSKSLPKARTCPSTACPSQRLAPVHRQQILPKGSHLSTDSRSFPKARTYPLTAGPSQRLEPIHRQHVLPKGSHLSTDGRSFHKLAPIQWRKILPKDSHLSTEL